MDARLEMSPKPAPMETVETWMGSQKERSAGTTGPALT